MIILQENIKEHDSNLPQTPDHPYRILVVEGSGFGKTNLYPNLISCQPDIDKIYLYAKDPNEAEYQLLISKREGEGIKYFNDSEAFIWILEWYGWYL